MWVKKIKWLNRKVNLCQNKCYHTYESPSSPLLPTLSKNAPKKPQGEKMVNEISKIHLHQNVDDKEKSCRAFIKPSKCNQFPFSKLQAFHKWVQSIVEIQISPKSWELMRVRVCQMQDFPCTWWYKNPVKCSLFMFMRESSTIRIRKGR